MTCACRYEDQDDDRNKNQKYYRNHEVEVRFGTSRDAKQLNKNDYF